MKNIPDIRSWILFACIVPATVHMNAQERWFVELRPSVNIPTHEVDGRSLATGPGMEVGIAYLYTPQWGVQFGMGYGQFNTFGTAGQYYVEQGASLGLRFFQPLIGRVYGVLGAGSVYHQLFIKEGNGQELARTDLGFGWQAEGGIALVFDERWSVSPTIRYRSLSREINEGDVTDRIDLDHISIALAFGLWF